jgi:hypothetical protein
MKKTLLLFSSMLISCLCGFAQSITLTPSTNEPKTNQVFTVTASGESDDTYSIVDISYDASATRSQTYGGQNTIGAAAIIQKHYYVKYQSPADKTSFTFSAQDVNAPDVLTLYFNVTYRMKIGGQAGNYIYQNVTGTPLSVNIRLIPPPPVTTYTSTKSGIFTKNSCGVGYVGSAVTYSYTASSTTSQAAADAAAQSAVNANGQSYANSNGTCTPAIYVRTEFSNLTTNREDHYATGTGHDLGDVDGYTEKTYGDLVIKVYSNAACTVPFSLSSALTVKLNIANFNGTLNTVPITIPANTSSYSMGNNLMQDYSNIAGIENNNQYWYEIIDNSNAYFPVSGTRF